MAPTKVVDAIQSTRDSIANVNTYSNGISAAIEEQSAVTMGISDNMKGTTVTSKESLENINTIYNQITLVNESVSEVQNISKTLISQSELVKDHIDKFVNQLKD